MFYSGPHHNARKVRNQTQCKHQLLSRVTVLFPLSAPAAAHSQSHRVPAQRPVSSGGAGHRRGAAAGTAESRSHAGNREERRGATGCEAGEGQERIEKHAG